MFSTYLSLHLHSPFYVFDLLFFFEKTVLDLNSNNMGDLGTIAVIMACQDHPTMQSLNIASNDLTAAIIPSLCDYVKGSTRLKDLDICHNYIGREM